MAGVDLRTVAELMGHSSIQMTMRYAHLAQHNRAAVDWLVRPSEPRQAAKKGKRAMKRGDELVTKSVTGKNQVSISPQRDRGKLLKISSLQNVAP